MRCAPLLIALALVSGATLCPDLASAGDVAAADQLFREAKELLAAGRTTEACAKFEASYAADPGLGALLNLANCLETDGRLASAYARWGDAAEQATRLGDDRAAFAKERREALQGKLPTLAIEVRGQVPDLDVFRGNTKLQPGAYGSPLPTDPGTVAVQVVRGDSVLWEQRLSLEPGQKASVSVDLEAIAAQNPAPLKKRVDERAGGSGYGTAPTEGFWNTQRWLGLGVGGAGLIVVGVGLGLGGVASGKVSDLDALCTAPGGDRRYCVDDYEEVRSDAATMADVSQWVTIGGGLVAAVGVTLFVTASSSAAELDDRASLPTITPWVGDREGGLVVTGSF